MTKKIESYEKYFGDEVEIAKIENALKERFSQRYVNFIIELIMLNGDAFRKTSEIIVRL